mmetsp:Transcript_21901/g.50858  ORF Transcript_21901/g.50858 Transcript_21901/m.50858 type:complete len:217 (+) Transcript_21901:541-1191(+)
MLLHQRWIVSSSPSECKDVRLARPLAPSALFARLRDWGGAESGRRAHCVTTQDPHSTRQALTFRCGYAAKHLSAAAPSCPIAFPSRFSSRNPTDAPNSPMCAAPSALKLLYPKSSVVSSDRQARVPSEEPPPAQKRLYDMCSLWREPAKTQRLESLATLSGPNLLLSRLSILILSPAKLVSSAAPCGPRLLPSRCNSCSCVRLAMEVSCATPRAWR